MDYLISDLTVDVAADIEISNIQNINGAYEGMLKSDVH